MAEYFTFEFIAIVFFLICIYHICFCIEFIVSKHALGTHPRSCPRDSNIEESILCLIFTF